MESFAQKSERIDVLIVYLVHHHLYELRREGKEAYVWALDINGRTHSRCAWFLILFSPFLRHCGDPSAKGNP
jgi:hypothetical protein